MDQDFLSVISARVRHIPFWIDTKSKTDKKVYQQLRKTTEFLTTNVLLDYILMDEEVQNICLFFHYEYEKCLQFGYDYEIEVHFEMYIKFLFDMLLQYEYYEQAENLKNINSYFFRFDLAEPKETGDI